MFYFDTILNCKVLKSDYLRGLNHFFTTRELILKTKDDTLILKANQNRENLKSEFGLKNLVTPEQRHTSNVCFVSDSKNYEQTDALILNSFDTGVFLNFADCTPVILYDKVQNTAAIAHAGWRGTVQKIAVKTAKLMTNNPKNLIGVIGPSICHDCFETSKEIMEALQSTVTKNFTTCRNGKYYADLKKINAAQLFEIGVQKIDIAPYCTFCDNEKFFSYRKENKTTNRMSAFISLQKDRPIHLC